MALTTSAGNRRAEKLVSKTTVLKVDPEPVFCGYQAISGSPDTTLTSLGVSLKVGLGTRTTVWGVIRRHLAIMCLFFLAFFSRCVSLGAEVWSMRRAWHTENHGGEVAAAICPQGGWNGGDVDNPGGKGGGLEILNWHRE